MMTGGEFPSIGHHPCPDPLPPAQAELASLPSEGSFQGHSFTGSGPPLCTGCSRPILDQFILQVQGHTWHSRCLQCAACGVSLTQMCYEGNNQLYCQEDFYRLFGSHCSACKATIPPTDVVRRAHDNVYHLNCFRCSVCAKELRTGDEFYLGMGGHLLCHVDYVAVKEKEQDENENPDRRPTQTASSTSGAATADDQRTKALTEYYARRNSNPKRQEMEEIAGRLGMELAEVRTWFKQKRAKTRHKGNNPDNSPTKHHTTNKVTPPLGGHPLPIVNKARSPGRLPTSACHPIQVAPPLIPGHAPFQPSNITPLPVTNNNHNFRAWEELWSNDFVPPNVDLEPVHLKNGEVVRLDTNNSGSSSNAPLPVQPITSSAAAGLHLTDHAPSLLIPPSSVVSHHPHSHHQQHQHPQHQHPCNMSNNNSNKHGIGNVPWVS